MCVNICVCVCVCLPTCDDNNDEGDDDVCVCVCVCCGGGVPLERAPSFCETNEFLSEKKKELCLGFRVSFNASLQFFFCVDKLFVSSFVLSLFIYYKRLRRRRSHHLDFPNDEAIVFCVHWSRRALSLCRALSDEKTLRRFRRERLC